MSLDHTQQDIGTSPTMTDGKPIPEDVWRAILRLEAKRIRQGGSKDEFWGESISILQQWLIYLLG